ncbi:unnamed protein product [Trichobilharzia regenti]|nr:unnamed protein product [Trichobilharzia regenti]
MPTKHRLSSSAQDGEYEVEDLIDMRTVNGEPEYLIKWKGHPQKGSQVRDVVPAAQANIRCPQTVIRFYESILHFT